MTPSFVQILIVAVVVVLLFGRGKISALMGDVAQGIKSFKKGMKEEPGSEQESDDEKVIEHEPAETATAKTASKERKAS